VVLEAVSPSVVVVALGVIAQAQALLELTLRLSQRSLYLWALLIP
jgi:hypothetical protein